MKVAIYLRKSRADIEAEARGEGETLSRHRRALLDLARNEGYHVVEVKEEIASGERIAFRPKMMELLREVENGEYDAVLCMDLDRLARGNMQEQAMILDTFRPTGKKITPPRKVYDLDDEIDEELSEIQAFFARKEFKIITRRLKAGRWASIKEGNWIFGSAPYGYRIVKDDKGYTLEPHPDEAPILQKIFEWYTDPDNPIGSNRIAARLNEMGVPSRTGKKWTPYVIVKILQNVMVYAGRIYINRREYKKTPQGRKRTLKTDWNTLPGRHKPLIKEDIARLVVERIKRREIPPNQRKFKLKNPLAGIVVCAQCGRNLQRRVKFNREYLICEYCPDIYGSLLSEVETDILHNLKEWLSKYKVKIESKGNDEAADILPSLIKQKAAAEHQKDRLHDLLERGVYDVDTFVHRSQVLTERIIKLEAAIQEAKRREKKTDIVPRIENLLDNYEGAEPHKRNRLLKTVVNKVVYEKRKPGGKFQVDVFPRI